LNTERHTNKQMMRKGNKCVVVNDVVVVVVIVMLHPRVCACTSRGVREESMDERIVRKMRKHQEGL